jgi:2-polyprenyl-3-methyl-5-hydroxy-6-metoxy-1,4-benzoquinol methylase
VSEDFDRYIDWKDWRDGSFGMFGASDARYFTVETGIVARSGARVLEVGFGNGSFLGWVRSLGVETWGVELSPGLVERANTFLGVRRAFGDLNDPQLTAVSGSFTHIVAFDVVEHIAQADLPIFLNRLKALLARDGRIVLRFPNGDSPFGRAHQHGDPTHVTTIGSGKIRYLALQAGLTVDVLRAPSSPITGAGLGRAILRSAKAMVRACMERAVGHLYFGGYITPLDPNYTAILVHAPVRTNPGAA